MSALKELSLLFVEVLGIWLFSRACLYLGLDMRSP